MEKVKQEVFSNFNYGIIESIDKRCVDVKCTYNYKGKTLTHYFSYAKSGNKQNSYYIGRAKADMDKLIKNKKADSIAKKDLNGSKATFFKRHKKPILVATTAVLVAGIATAATLITLKYLNKTNPTAVTEEEIDDYLNISGGTFTPIDSRLVSVIREEARENYAKISGFTAKNLSSYPFYTKSKQPEVLANDYGFGVDFISSYNDTTGLLASNKALQKKSVFGTYLDVSIHKDKEGIPCFTLYAKDEGTKIADGNTFTTNVESNQVYLASLTQKEGEPEAYAYLPFVNTEMNYQGVKMNESYRLGDYVSSVEEAKEKMQENAYNSIELFVNMSRIDQLIGSAQFLADGNGGVLCSYIVSSAGPTIQLSDDLSIPTYARSEYVWRFRNDKELGWVLDSYAQDGNSFFHTISPYESSYYPSYRSALYIRTNDKGETLSKPFSINKMKGFTKVKYGAKTDYDTSGIKYNPKSFIWSYKPAVAYISTSDDSYESNLMDITPYYRADNPGKTEYKYYETFYLDPSDNIYFVIGEQPKNADETIYCGFEDLDDASKIYFKQGDPIRGSNKHIIKVKEEVSYNKKYAFELLLSTDDKISLSSSQIFSGK